MCFEADLSIDFAGGLCLQNFATEAEIGVVASVGIVDVGGR